MTMPFTDDDIRRTDIPKDAHALLHDLCYHHDGRDVRDYVKRAQQILSLPNMKAPNLKRTDTANQVNDCADEVYDYVCEWLRHIAKCEIPQRQLDIAAIRAITDRPNAALRKALRDLLAAHGMDYHKAGRTDCEICTAVEAARKLLGEIS